MLFKTTRRPKLFRNPDCYYIKYKKRQSKAFHLYNQNPIFFFISFPHNSTYQLKLKNKHGHVPYLDYIERVNDNGRREKRCQRRRQLTFQPQSHPNPTSSTCYPQPNPVHLHLRTIVLKSKVKHEIWRSNMMMITKSNSVLKRNNTVKK